MTKHDNPYDDVPDDYLDQWDERLADYVDERMSTRDRDRFEAEMRVSPPLRAKVEEYRATVETLRSAMTAPTKPVDLADRVMASIAAEESAPRPAARSAWPIFYAVASAAALLTIAIWVDSWGQVPLRSEQDATARVDVEKGAVDKQTADKPAHDDVAEQKLQGVAGAAGGGAANPSPKKKAPENSDDFYLGTPDGKSKDVMSKNARLEAKKRELAREGVALGEQEDSEGAPERAKMRKSVERLEETPATGVRQERNALRRQSTDNHAGAEQEQAVVEQAEMQQLERDPQKDRGRGRTGRTVSDSSPAVKPGAVAPRPVGPEAPTGGRSGGPGAPAAGPGGPTGPATGGPGSAGPTGAPPAPESMRRFGSRGSRQRPKPDEPASSTWQSKQEKPMAQRVANGDEVTKGEKPERQGTPAERGPSDAVPPSAEPSSKREKARLHTGDDVQLKSDAKMAEELGRRGLHGETLQSRRRARTGRPPVRSLRLVDRRRGESGEKLPAIVLEGSAVAEPRKLKQGEGKASDQRVAFFERQMQSGKKAAAEPIKIGRLTLTQVTNPTVLGRLEQADWLVEGPDEEVRQLIQDLTRFADESERRRQRTREVELIERLQPVNRAAKKKQSKEKAPKGNEPVEQPGSSTGKAKGSRRLVLRFRVGVE